MASSGSVDFSVNRNEIIEAALRAARILGKDQTPDASHITTGAQALNMIVKQWQGKADFAPGLKVWSRKTAYLFLQEGEHQYDLGPSGDHWTGTYYSTTTDAAEAAAQTIISVTSTTNMTNGDNIGIVLDDGTIHWSTISSFSAGDTVTIASGLASAAASGSRVFWYTSKARRPLEVLTAVLRDTSAQDSPMYPMSLEAFESITDKTADGTPQMYVYEPMLTNGRISFDREPDDVTKVVRIVFLGTLEDFDSATDTPDYPQEWFRALKFNLALDLWNEYKDGDPPVSLEKRAAQALAVAQSTNPETSDLHFQPGLEDGE